MIPKSDVKKSSLSHDSKIRRKEQKSAISMTIVQKCCFLFFHYLNIELSDGTVAWAAEFGLIINAKTGVIKDKVPIYKRPDLLTISDEEFSPMDILAITEENDDWLKVTGEKKKLKGWIKKSYVSINEEDIAFALIAKRALAAKDDKPLLDKIQNILDNNPYPTSIFVETLNKIAQEEKNKKRLEEIMLEEGI